MITIADTGRRILALADWSRARPIGCTLAWTDEARQLVASEAWSCGPLNRSVGEIVCLGISFVFGLGFGCEVAWSDVRCSNVLLRRGGARSPDELVIMVGPSSNASPALIDEALESLFSAVEAAVRSADRTAALQSAAAIVAGARKGRKRKKPAERG